VNPEDDPLVQLKALKTPAVASPDPLDELKRTKAPLTHNKPKTGQMGIPISDDSPEDATVGQQIAGGLASFGRSIPGVETLQAGARSFAPMLVGPQYKPQPYGEALSDVRQAEESAHPFVRNLNSVTGGTIAAAAMPGTNLVRQGAAYGAAEGALGADPVSAGQRAFDTGKGAVIGALSGKVLGSASSKIARVMKAKSLGTTALQRTGAMESADAAAYAKAASEGIGATDPAVTAALSHPTVKPFAAEIRNSPIYQGADDATVLREAYKLMTEKQQTLARQIINSKDYKAGSTLEKEEIRQGKKQLLKAADRIMPSLRPAVYQHATAKNEYGAFATAANATRRALTGTSVAAENFLKNTPEAFLDKVPTMKPGQARAALEGVLGRLKEAKSPYTLNPARGFGIPRAIKSSTQVNQFLDALDKRVTSGSSAAAHWWQANPGVVGQLRRALAVSLGGEMSR